MSKAEEYLTQTQWETVMALAKAIKNDVRASCKTQEIAEENSVWCLAEAITCVMTEAMVK